MNDEAGTAAMSKDVFFDEQWDSPVSDLWLFVDVVLGVLLALAIVFVGKSL